MLSEDDDATVIIDIEETDDEEDEDEKISLLSDSGQWAKFLVRVISAENVVPKALPMFSRIFSAEISTFVQVAFSGLTAKTTVIKNTCSPVWNQQMAFTTPFPPTANEIIFRLFQWNCSTSSTLMASRVIDLSTISSEGNPGFLPTFGPSFVHLYGSEKCGSPDDHVTVYRGSLLIELATELIDAGQKLKENVQVEVLDRIYQESLGFTNQFLLYGCVFDVSMNKKYGAPAASLQLTIGSPEDMEDTEEPAYIKPRTPFMEFSQIDNTYIHLPFNEAKPCIGARCIFYDERKRAYLSNVLSKFHNRLFRDLSSVQEMVFAEEDGSEEKLADVLNKLIGSCSSLKEMIQIEMNNRNFKLKTKLEKSRMKFLLSELDDVSTKASELIALVWEREIQESIQLAKEFLHRIQCQIQDPQDELPNVFCRLNSESKLLAFLKIPSRDILYSTKPDERGEMCGQLKTVFFKIPRKKKKKKYGKPEGEDFQVKVTLYLWLGTLSDSKEVLEGLPPGFCKTPDIRRIGDEKCPIPNFILYAVKHPYKLNAYIFQARAIVAADATGLSDPYVRVIFQNQCRKSQALYSVLNPMWNEQLVMEFVEIYGDPSALKENPPLVMVEIFDNDKLGSDDYMGRVMGKPYVQLLNEAPTVVRLKWYDIQRRGTDAGELLAAFELIQLPKGAVSPAEKPKRKIIAIKTTAEEITRIPPEIAPTLSRFRLEVLFWGLREMKKIKKRTVKHLRVDVECAGQTLQSSTIRFRRCQNFPLTLAHLDLDFPEEEIYCPPLSIVVRDTGDFGISRVVGSHVIKSLRKYVLTPDIPKEEEQKSEKWETMKKRTRSILSRPSLYDSLPFIHRQTRYSIVRYEAESSDAITDRLLEFTLRKPRKESTLEDEEYVDWWTRYDQSKLAFRDLEEAHGSYRAKTLYDMAHTNKDVTEEKIPHSDVHTMHGKFSLLGPSGDHGSRKSTVREQAFNEPLIRIYPCELENVPSYNGFKEWLHSFDLSRGKQKLSLEDQDRKVGVFKGSFKLYKIPLPVDIQEPFLPKVSGSDYYFRGLPSNDPVGVMIRVYVVKAIDLQPQDVNNKVDAYPVVHLGKKKISDKDNYISKQLSPVFGKCFTFHATFPQDSHLTVEIFDWDLLGADDLIGRTEIDLENRFYSRHRPNCGIPEVYEISGPNQWRDSVLPTDILTELCRKYVIDGPHIEIDRISMGKKRFIFLGDVIHDDEGLIKENMALAILHRWKEVAGFPLVTEHIETRALYHPEKVGVQGKLEMWVDMFPLPMIMTPTEREISPRKPVSYELRVIIWNTDEVILADDSALTGEKSSDIYVKGWLKRSCDEQKTDIHYGSQTGEGNFNWRFVFPFDYLAAEKMMVVTQKESAFSWDEMQSKIPPELKLQVWDSDHFSADDCLGSVTLNLCQLPRGAKIPENCSLSTIDENDVSVPRLSLFKQPRVKGWWPVYDKNIKGENEMTGKIEVEFHLLKQEEAEQNPAGRGRKEPDALSKPQRPVSTLTNIFNPMRVFRVVIWRRYKRIIIKLIIIMAMALLFVLFVYSTPGYIVKKILGA